MIGDVIGTLHYLSPEQLRGSSEDERSDIWALGVLLYETVSGHVPFEATTIGELYEKISKSDQVPASTLNPEVPKDVELIISRCLKKNPASRYQSVRELREDVALLNWGNVEDSVSGRRARSARSIQRTVSWRTAVAALALLVTFCFVAYFAIEYWPKPDVSGKTVESKHDEPVESQSDAARTNAFAGNSNAETRSVLIRLWQGTAEVYRDEKLVGHTPYPVEGALGTKVNLTLKQPGYEDYNVEVTVTENTKDYFIPMHAKSDEGKE